MQGPPAAEIQVGRRHVGGVLGFVIGQAEERLAHLRGSLIPDRRVPGRHPTEPFEPVVDRAVELEQVQSVFDQRDEGQEMLAVEPVLVEIAGRAVRGRDDHQLLVDDQGAEQPAHDHRVGRIVDHHLVETQAAQALRNPFRDKRDRIAGLAFARLLQQGVHFEHEGVEVDPALVFDRQRRVEQVHQHRLAAPDAAPQIRAARRFRLVVQQLAEQPGLPASRLQCPL